MTRISPEGQKRRPHGELKTAIRAFLAQRAGAPASIQEIIDGIEPLIGKAPASSYRSALQDERYFKRISRGIFALTESGMDGLHA